MSCAKAFAAMLPFLFFCSFAESAPAPSVDDIVSKARQVLYYQGRDGRFLGSLAIRDSRGQERLREFTILRLDKEDPADKGKKCGDQKYYIYFHKPPDVNRMAFLVWKYADKEDDRWLYLPAVDLVKRIAAVDKRTSFVGSNFFYDDISGRDLKEDVHELLETTPNYYVVKSVPKNPGTVEFSLYKSWIHVESFVVVRSAYYDRQGKEYRVYDALKVEHIQGFPTVVESRMKDLKENGESLLRFERIEYNIGLSDDIFTERYLRQPPAKFLKW